MLSPCTQFGVCHSVVALLIAAAASACSGQQDAPPTATATPTDAARPGAADDAPIPTTPSPFDALPESVRSSVDQPFTGDFDEMVEATRDSRRRDLQPHALLHRCRAGTGITYEALKSFENDLNTDLKTGNLKIHVVIVPMSRDQL